jgi:hypothetical protein
MLADVGPIISILKDVSSISAACVAMYVALKGLQAWKRQLRGNADFDLARRFLRATYGVRHAVQLARAPFLTAAEMNSALAARTEAMTAVARRGKDDDGEMAAYQIRWQRVNAALADFHGVALEAEALWGPDAAAKTAEVIRLANELHHAIQLWVNRSERPLNQEEDEKVLRTISEIDADGYRDYSDSFAIALAGVDNLTKPYLSFGR